MMSTAAVAINVTATTATILASQNPTTTSLTGSSIPPIKETLEVTPIFLETKAAQGIAGIFVFCALFLTCQQVR